MHESKKREIRINADTLRSKCTVGKYGLTDLFKDCEKLQYKLLRYPLGENANLGFTVRKDNDIVIFTNSSVRLSREIFTLAHELGHAVLHMGYNSSFIDNAATISGKSDDEKEQEANYFAACLLMPYSDVDRFLDYEVKGARDKGLSAMDVARIMSEFNVSFDMALNRLENLCFINQNQKLNLSTERTEKKVGNLLQSVGGNARLNIPGNEIKIPYEYIDYVIYNYNHNAIPRETLERALAYCHLTVEDINDKLIDNNVEENDDLDELIGGLDI